MAWDDDKATGDELTSDEWDNHVTDQKDHSSRHESGGTDEVDHDNLLNYVADEHVDHTTVTISAGNALTGGGDISASRTIDVASNSIDSNELVNDSVTITSGDGLKNGGTVALGGSLTIDVEPADFAGGLLSDDGSDNLKVDESNIDHDAIDQTTVTADDHHAQDQSGNYKDGGSFEIDIAEFAGGLGTVDQVPITDGSAVSWGTVPNAGLTNDSVTVTAGTLLTGGGSVSLGGSVTLDVDESSIDHDSIDQSTVDEADHHIRGGFSRVNVTSTSVTASRWQSLWVDTSAAGGAVTVTLPADGDTNDGDRVEIGVEDATNDTDVSPNTGQSILGTNPTLTQIGDVLTFEYKSNTSNWMVK